jgi:hypothetical protein
MVETALHHHHAGFEPQRASPFMKWVKNPKYLEKPTEPER